MPEITLVLSDLAAFKSYASIPATDTGRDALITALLRSVSRKIAEHLGWLRPAAVRTEQYDVDEYGQRVWWLKVRPVTSVAAVVYDLQREFSGEPIPESDYVVDLTTGKLTLDAVYGLEPAPGVLQVTYTAGYTHVYDIRSYAPDLELACQVQAKATLERARSPAGEVSISEQGGAIRLDALKFIPEVLEILRPYRSLGW